MLFDLIPYVFTALSAFYFLLLLLVIFGLGGLRGKNTQNLPFVSIVITARNEAGRIIPTLQSLERLYYPPGRFEVILADDASEDETGTILEEFSAKYAHWRVLHISEKNRTLRGKKYALNEAIKTASGAIIFTTDADCILPADWLKVMTAYFDDRTAMVMGHSPVIAQPGILGILLKFDTFFSAILSAASTKLGFAMTSVGRNLAYRKAAYERVGGFEALRRHKSGDDVHLTERFRTRKVGKIDFCADPRTFVITRAPSKAGDIFQQQIRYHSKILRKSWPTVILSILLFLAVVFFYGFPFLYPAWIKIWLFVIVVKLALEYGGLMLAASKFQHHDLIPFFIPLQIFYPVYVIFFGLIGSLQLYRWKK